MENALLKNIVIVGRTNVGKSMLFNKLCNKHLSITCDMDDTTSDYISYAMSSVVLTDTIGLHNLNDFNSTSGKFILNSNVILFVVAGAITHEDKRLNDFLWKHNKNIWLIVNQIDRIVLPDYMYQQLKFSKIFFTSTTQHKGLMELRTAMGLELPIEENTVAIIGRCNSGKSSLINCLVGYERSSTSPIAGTTRDSVAVPISTPHHRFYFVDTAGYGNSDLEIDRIASNRREHSLKSSKGAIVLLDGELGLTKTDKDVIWHALETVGFVIIAINKSETLQYHEIFRYFALPAYIPVIYISAKEKKLGSLLNLIDECYSHSQRIFSTKELNTWLHNSAFELRSYANQKMNIKYIQQIPNSPQITIAYFTTEELHPHSVILLTRKFNEYFKSLGTPIHFKWKKTKKNIKFNKS